MRRWLRSEGAALLVALMATMLMMVLGTTLVLTTITETTIVMNYRSGIETLYAADAAIESAIDRLRVAPEWPTLATDAAAMVFTDGPPSGTRLLADGSTVSLDDETVG